MKILFVHPPLNPGGEVTPPLGLCTLAAWLKYHGYSVSILDFDLELKAFEEKERFQLIESILILRIESFTPDVICVTSMYSNSLYAECIIKYAKKNDPAIITVAGGSHFGAQGALSLKRIPQLDYVLEGESETALLELLEYLDAGGQVENVHNLIYCISSNIYSTAKADLIDLSVLPNTWKEIHEIIDISKYAATIPASSTRKIIYVEAGRGCPFYCSFCATAPFWNRKYRVKKAELIIDEIEFLYKTYGYNGFVLIHDLLPVNKKFISDLCEKMIEKQLPVEWMMNSRIDINLDGYLPKLKAAGCWKFFYGVESSSERIQQVISKHLSKKETINCLKTNLEHGILSTCSFVIGFPDETSAEISETVKLAALCKMNGAETVQFHRLRLFPPSKLSKEKIETEFDLEALRIEYPFIHITPAEIHEIKNDASFFMGYHSPRSLAGSTEQLAQLEMFFHHSIALAPLTIALSCQFYKNDMVNAFYEIIKTNGFLKREEIEWQTSQLFRNWKTISPLLHELVMNCTEVPLWQQQLLQAVFQYENSRLQFCIGHSQFEKMDGFIDKGNNWVAVYSHADIFSVVAALKNEEELKESYLAPVIIVLSSKKGKNTAYSFDLELRKKLADRNEKLIDLIEESV
jgi:radical SAM superfamily enzyme YgiQ (UPF0313 family)